MENRIKLDRKLVCPLQEHFIPRQSICRKQSTKVSYDGLKVWNVSVLTTLSEIKTTIVILGIYLGMREICLLHERERSVELFLKAHDEHGVQGIEHRYAPSIEPLSVQREIDKTTR